MKEIFDRMYKHPFMTVMIIGSITGGIAEVIRAINVAKK